MGSPVLFMVSLVATSNETGCCTTTGITSLVSEMLTGVGHDELSLFADSTLEPVACHTCRCMWVALRGSVERWSGLCMGPTPTSGVSSPWSIHLVTANARALSGAAAAEASTK